MSGKRTHDKVSNAEFLSWASRNEDAKYLKHYANSVELIQDSANRGMTRGAMEKIWPSKLLNLVLRHEEPK
jgi:hypothetical protein